MTLLDAVRARASWLELPDRASILSGVWTALVLAALVFAASFVHPTPPLYWVVWTPLSGPPVHFAALFGLGIPILFRCVRNARGRRHILVVALVIAWATISALHTLAAGHQGNLDELMRDLRRAHWRSDLWEYVAYLLVFPVPVLALWFLARARSSSSGLILLYLPITLILGFVLFLVSGRYGDHLHACRYQGPGSDPPAWPFAFLALVWEPLLVGLVLMATMRWPSGDARSLPS